MYVKVRGQYRASFSSMLGFIFQSRIFHCTPESSLIWLGWLLLNPRGGWSPASTPSTGMIAVQNQTWISAWVQGIPTQILCSGGRHFPN